MENQGGYSLKVGRGGESPSPQEKIELTINIIMQNCGSSITRLITDQYKQLAGKLQTHGSIMVKHELRFTGRCS